MKQLLLAFLFFAPLSVGGQWYYGTVRDQERNEPLPFAVLKVNNGQYGAVADLMGCFSFQLSEPVTELTAAYMGFEPQTLLRPKPNDSLRIRLAAAPNQLAVLVFKPPYDKIRTIINRAIANRARNCPERYPEYACSIYYKMVVYAQPSDSAMAALLRDSSKDGQQTLRFLKNQYILMSETYSRRRWKQPQSLQEDVLATRLSGLKKSLFTSFVTDVLPFHAYTDYLTLNGKDYPNPIAPGYAARYEFNLTDEFTQGNDTLWLLSFRPKSSALDALRGTVYISSNGYGIANLIASAYDKNLKRDIRLEQQYQQVGGRWFPKELNYVLEFSLPEQADKPQKKDSAAAKGKPEFTKLLLKGNSRIDSITFSPDPRTAFSKRYPVRLLPGADTRADSVWQKVRPAPLSALERETYRFNDSLGAALHFDRYTPYLEKSVDGRVPIGFLDVDLTRLYRYNRYEGSRLGFGFQTNEKISPYASVGAWYGYGLLDQTAKYGLFAAFSLDRYRDYTITLGYSEDLRDPGRMQISRDLDRNALRVFLLSRADFVRSYSAVATQQLGYWTTEISARAEQLRPMYAYQFLGDSGPTRSFDVREVSVLARYAFGERRIPVMGRYLRGATKYPTAYGRLTTGQLTAQGRNSAYTQALTALSWQKHINRMGNERWLLIAGKSWSDAPLPLSKLFAGNGFRFDQSALYAFGGMLTLYPYDVYTDAFVNAYWRHDFDRRLYRVGASAPNVALQHSLLVGHLSERGAHQWVAFDVPERAYHESGVLLNNLYRQRYFNIYYLTLNAGFFYHWTPQMNLAESGRFVFGFGVDW